MKAAQRMACGWLGNGRSEPVRLKKLLCNFKKGDTQKNHEVGVQVPWIKKGYGVKTGYPNHWMLV